MQQRKINHIVAGIYERSKARDRKCFIDSCVEKAINSHLVQKNGILRQISDNDHFYEMKLQHFPKQHFSVVRQGINKGMSFKGFCGKHDFEIFHPIEQKNLDFGIYKNQLLASYRAALREFREKENILEVYKRIAESRSIKHYFNLYDLKTKYEAEQFLLWDAEFVLNEINKDLIEGTESFLFRVYQLPKLEICASAIYSTESIADSFSDIELDPKNKRLINTIIINILPEQQFTTVILGCHKMAEASWIKEIAEFEQGSVDVALKKLNDILLRNISWGCSASFYNLSVEPIKQKVIKTINHFTKKKTIQ